MVSAMRVLISAYACEPDSGSEPGVGWNWAVQAALHGHDVHVITRANNRASIEGTLREHPIVGLTFHYYDLPTPVPGWKRRSGNLGLLAYYYLWQFGAWRVASRLHKRLRFDLSHHVTFVNDWMPSGVGWIGVPFIWGPVGGSTNVLPHGLREFIPPSSRRYERTRRMLQRSLRGADPFVALTRRRARLILTFTREALQGIPLAHRWKARAIVHIGVSPSEPPSTTVEPGTNPILTIASGSRLVHWKGFDLLVEAFARHVRGTDGLAKLLITGDGPFRKQLEDLIARLDISDSVRLLGHLPSRADVYRVVGSADLYALPTLRDGPPVAILEAMAAGRPILCLDRAATAEMVPIKAAFKIPVISRAQVVDDIARSLGWADTHRAELVLMGREARKYALEHHDWRRIGRKIDAMYREVQSSRSADAPGQPDGST
jgi:glycosyltransferase involved in cell wall biosynthesis